MCNCCYFLMFVFKQKTAYCMRISDLSSDVCSSDLIAHQRHVLARLHDPRLADRQHEIVKFGHLESAAVHQLVFEEHDRILAADRGLQQPLAILRVIGRDHDQPGNARVRSEEHTSELQSLMRISYAVFCLKKTKINKYNTTIPS